MKFSRNFSEDEDKERFQIFKKNIIKFDKHNAKYDRGEVSYTVGANQFTDRKPDELEFFRGRLPNPKITP